MPEVSVIICSHNPREDYLRRVLDALRAQTLPFKNWELLLVDNASEKPLAGRFDLSWHPDARHVREEKTGLTHARLCGIGGSRGEILVFVDDDNLLYPNYMQTALKIAADYPQLGAWGGSYFPEFEVEPPAELRPWLGGLPLETVKKIVWAKLPKCSEATPAGAGIVVRRNVALRYREQVLHDPVRQSLGRSGSALVGGEDGDMGLCGFDIGLGTGKFPHLELTHIIPARRLTLKYLEGMHEGFGYAGTILSAVHQSDSIQGKIPRFGNARLFLLNLMWLLSGKSRVDRRLGLAPKRGGLRARKDLERLGYGR